MILFVASPSWSELVCFCRVVPDCAILDLKGIGTDRFEVYWDLCFKQYLVDIEKGARTVNENWILVACRFKSDDSSFADEVDFVGVRICSLDNFVVLVRHVSHRHNHSV